MNDKNYIKEIYINVRFEFSICLIIILALFAAYWGIWNYEFINFDDDIYVSKNPHVLKGFTKESIRWALFDTRTYWQPVTWFSHMLDCEIFGVNAGMHHLVNLLIHITNSLLLFFVFRTMTGTKWESAFIAILFALHPINVDSVAWISERKNVLSTFWWVLAIGAYCLYAKKQEILRYVLTLIFFVLSLMTKPMAVTLPFVFLLLDYWPLDKYWRKNPLPSKDVNESILEKLKNIDIFRRILDKSPFFIIIILFFIFFFILLQDLPSNSKLFVPMSLRISNALVSYILYIWKIILPLNLTVFYPFPSFIPLWQTAASSVLLFLVTVIFIKSIRKNSYLSIGWFWYLGTLFPVIGLMQAGLWPKMADRWMYVPQIGLYIIAVFGISSLISARHIKKILISCIIIFLIIPMTLATRLQVNHWKNSITLFQHAIQVTSNNFLGHENLAVALYNKKQYKEAIYHFGISLKIRPDNSSLNYKMSVALYTVGKTNEAVKFLLKAIKIDPNNYEAHVLLGGIMEKLGRKTQAIVHYQKALLIKSYSPYVLFRVGRLFMDQKNYSKAVKYFKKTLNIKPGHTEAQKYLKKAMVSIQKKR